MGDYTYGPVPSRRLGRSLGVDLVPLKTCNFNCIYCQLGPTPQTTVERRDYVPVEAVVEDVRRRLEGCPRPDYITLAGSGEPTLLSHFGEVASGIRRFSDVPLALLTNGALFFRPEVRAECDALDLVLPSLDAGDEETFQRINRPHPELTFERVVEGLVALREEFEGQVWLEVFIVDGVNSSDQQIGRIRSFVDRIDPHRVQVNNPVRPTAEAFLSGPPSDRLHEICAMLGPRAEIIAPAATVELTADATAHKEEVLALLLRRPCTLEDIVTGLGIHRNEVIKHVQALLDADAIRRRQRLYETYYEAAG